MKGGKGESSNKKNSIVKAKKRKDKENLTKEKQTRKPVHIGKKGGGKN